MVLSEFELIRRYFTRQTPINTATQLGIGDDCALLQIPADKQLAITTDTMVENVHFFADVNPCFLGHKLLAVNLSDLAAMGAKPIAVSLALTLLSADEVWLAGFTQGFLALAERYQVELIGGDTTQGPLTLTVQAMGLLPQGKALLRSGAKPGDLVFVSGPIGDAGLGLKIMQGYECLQPEQALARFHTPMPRVELGLALLDVANACIDISDGLAADLNHILQQSEVGALITFEAIPLSSSVLAYIEATGDSLLPLVAGDDYELCFTVAPDKAHWVPDGCFQIGVIEAEPGLRLAKSGFIQSFTRQGYEHFSANRR